jgi:RNA polymerase sigma factor (sigma-70 family)
LVAVPSIGRASQVTPRRAAPEADATRDLYQRYARQIYSYCLHQLGNREEAEDATQSTFLNAFRGIKRGVDPEFESAWLYKIAQNVCLTRQRSSSRRRRVETPGDLEAMQDYVPAHQADSDELIGLPEALESMPEQQRRALLLREWQGLSYKEIADELELSQGAVETLLFRARRTLANGLVDAPPKKASRRLRRSGDAGSLVAIVKSIVFAGGTKVAATVATVAATSVVAASPTTRHAVVDVVAPRHDIVPVHVATAAAKPAAKATHAAHATAPAVLAAVPHHAAVAPATAEPTHSVAKIAHRPALAHGRRVVHAFMPSHRSRVGVEPAAVAPAPPAPAPAPAVPAATAAAPAPAPAAQPPAAAGPAPVVAAPAEPAKAADSGEGTSTGGDKRGAPNKDDSDKAHGKKDEGGKAAATPPAVAVQPVTPAPVAPTTTPAPAAPAAAAAQSTPAAAPSDDHRSDKHDARKDGNRRGNHAAPNDSTQAAVAMTTTAAPTAAAPAPVEPAVPAATPPAPAAAAPAPTPATPAPAPTDASSEHGHHGEGHRK